MGRKKHFQARVRAPNIKALKASPKKKVNPFEIHVNRVKHQIVGRRTKHDYGLPGIARAKALKKRERTLLQEYKVRHKSNIFIDRRIAENDPTVDLETKQALRMAAEQKRLLSKKSIYNLNEDEELTHGGIPLSELDMKDGIIPSDDEDGGTLDSRFVEEQHFGGNFLTRVKENDSQNKGPPKSRKEWIEEIVQESKRKKAEMVQEQEQLNNAIEKLNEDYRDFLRIMSSEKPVKVDEKEKKVSEFKDYDVLVRELVYDRSRKADPKDRLKTAEELAQEEHKQLKELEAARIRRMKGELEELPSSKQSSSRDEFVKGYELEEPEEEKFVVCYKDGKLLGSDKLEKKEETETAEKLPESQDLLEVDADGVISEDGEENDDEDDESDQYSDVLEESETDEEDHGEEDEEKVKKSNATGNEKHPVDDDRKRELMEAAKKELPYTFEVPQDYDAFWALLESRSPSEVSTIVQRMIAYNHPSIGGDNSFKCQDIYAYLLQTLHVVSGSEGESPVPDISPLLYIDALIPHLYTLTQLLPSSSASALIQVIEEKHEEFAAKKVKRYPQADTFVFLKIAGMLFPTSDYQHMVATPVIVFLTQILGQSKISTRREVTAGLFTAYLLYEYLSTSRRFIPELCNFLNGLLFVCLPGRDKRDLPQSPLFKPVGPLVDILWVEVPPKEFSLVKFSLSSLLEESDMTNDFKLNVLHAALDLLTKVCNCWSHLPSIRIIMSTSEVLLDRLLLDNYPLVIQEACQSLRKAVASLPRSLKHLAKQKGRPKALKMLEPAIEHNIGDQKRSGSKEYQEKKRLSHKVKREMKAARREIQRDTAFLARQQLKETLESDAERKRKVKEILGSLSMQEGEYKKLKKMK